MRVLIDALYQSTNQPLWQVAVGTELSISLGPVGRTAATDLHAGRRGVMGAAFAYGQSKVRVMRVYDR